jgi:uncharacterized circularly permuted ATP-grasp superfamily protein
VIPVIDDGVTPAAAVWDGLLRPEVELSAEFCRTFTGTLRGQRLTFGDRVHCPFLRPFFLTTSDEARVGRVAETIASLAERVTARAVADPALLRQFALTPEEEQLVRIDPRYPIASTSSRLDAFLLKDALWFAEYNAESPAGMGYTEALAEVFDSMEVMHAFRRRFDVHAPRLVARLLEALLASYRQFGGRASTPLIAIVDWREVPTWSEFEILAERFERLGTRTIVCDPRELTFDGRVLSAAGRSIDLVYRRVLTSDIVERREACDALVRAYESGAVCVANALRCKICQKKAFFAVLTDEQNASLFTDAERSLIHRHIPWTRILTDARTKRDGDTIELPDYAQRHRAELVLKPSDEYGGKGVALGWELSQADWERKLEAALTDRRTAWIVQQRIPVRRETFPRFEPGAAAEFGEMLVDFAPYVFGGRLAGYLTRLSATGLANVTSGGGQVPVFVVEPRS